ncbi:hypothetical protein BDN70DRAFT_901835 [Pholiota conissans]|uniref:C2H2-type domain-containing protein n=1 Tax=Pholiota conissans TaxID=109636 RepID=A0A9P5YK69_9AGAR|nr:hypothetical protein BDN70DRAFT_901835 [Pholiota conissans]
MLASTPCCLFAHLPLVSPIADVEATLYQDVIEPFPSEHFLGYDNVGALWSLTLKSGSPSQWTETHSNRLPLSTDESHAQLQGQGQGAGTKFALHGTNAGSISRIKHAFERNIDQYGFTFNPSADLDIIVQQFKPQVATTAIRRECDLRKKNVLSTDHLGAHFGLKPCQCSRCGKYYSDTAFSRHVAALVCSRRVLEKHVGEPEAEEVEGLDQRPRQECARSRGKGRLCEDLTIEGRGRLLSSRYVTIPLFLSFSSFHGSIEDTHAERAIGRLQGGRRERVLGLPRAPEIAARPTTVNCDGGNFHRILPTQSFPLGFHPSAPSILVQTKCGLARRSRGDGSLTRESFTNEGVAVSSTLRAANIVLTRKYDLERKNGGKGEDHFFDRNPQICRDKRFVFGIFNSPQRRHLIWRGTGLAVKYIGFSRGGRNESLAGAREYISFVKYGQT